MLFPIPCSDRDFFSSAATVHDTDSYSNVDPASPPWNKPHMVRVCNDFYLSCILFVSILLKIFASSFMRDVGL